MKASYSILIYELKNLEKECFNFVGLLQNKNLILYNFHIYEVMLNRRYHPAEWYKEKCNQNISVHALQSDLLIELSVYTCSYSFLGSMNKSFP